MTEPHPESALRAWLEDALAFGVEDLLLPSAPEQASTDAPRAGLRRFGPGQTGDPRTPPLMGAVPAASASPDAEGAGGKQAALESIAQEAAACTRCSLATTRNRVVPGQGNPDAAIMFVGEAPGADEDQQGLAFVGRAGQLLTRMIEAMGLQREDVFIANVLKCRPPGNRDPQPDEVVSCSPFLERQLAVVRPRVVVALGGHAMKSLLGTDATVGRMRGAVHDYRGTPLVVTYHPAYLLRSPAMKKPAWDDLKLALKVIGREPPQRGLGGRPD